MRPALRSVPGVAPIHPYAHGTAKPVDLCVHIITVSAAMVGVCLTGIGLMRIFISIGHVDTIADDLLAGDAVLFLTACLTSYSAMRSRHRRQVSRLERASDVTFLIALGLMVLVCVFITYAIAASAP